ncbi:MAG TPA: M23 family metallopeptidase [Candidatus Paceibacterota bacterium]|nr:M23 family metallopeptidase [Candidatus Paceibacterota bacterium]
MRRTAASVVTLISALLVIGSFLPALARASVLETLLAPLSKATPQDPVDDGGPNLQNMQLLQPAYNLNPAPAIGGGDVTIVDNSALVSEEGPAGTIADIEKPKNGTISLYVVQPGDTLSSIAKLFGVTTGTILSANDLPRGSALQVGQQLVILPITGVRYTVRAGDTIESIAKAYNADPTEIEANNDVDNSSLAVGQQLIIPNAEVPSSSIPASSGSSSGPNDSGVIAHIVSGVHAIGNIIPFANNPAEPAHNVGPVGSADEIAYYIAPLTHYIQTQGIHGYNAVDLAAPIGTPILASAAGNVVVARGSGWNGGYGEYVVIQHDNGSQTLYAHMSKVIAYDGEHVQQGQVIGYVGETGEATGPHVHFEIRNGIRNPF